MTTLSKVRAETHQRTVNFRALDRLLESPKFETAFALDPMNTRILFAIQSGDIYAVEEWMKDVLIEELELGEMSLRALRAKAAQLGIPYPAKYTKDELIVRVAHVQRGSEEVGGVPHHGGQRTHASPVERGRVVPAATGY